MLNAIKSALYTQKNERQHRTQQRQLRSKQTEHKSRQREIAGLLDQLEGALDAEADEDSVAVTGVKITEEPVDIGHGWTQRHMFGSDDFDMWMREASAGRELPPYKYPDHCLTVLMIEGTALVTVGEDKTTKCLGDNQDILQVPQGTRVQMKAETDIRMVVIFRPPISYMRENG